MKLICIEQSIQSCVDCRLRSSCIFSNLDYTRLVELDRIQRRGVCANGSVIFTKGDQPQGIYCICSGRVKLSIYSSDGRAVIVGVATAGDVIGSKALLSRKPHILTAEAIEM